MAMRLRMRAASGGATLRVEVPDPGTVYDLQQVLSRRIGVPPDAIRLSLNKRDEFGGDPGIPLSAFGIRSGDLLYFMGEAVPVAEAVPDTGIAAPVQVPSIGSAPNEAASSSSSSRMMDGKVGDQASSSSSSSMMDVKEVAKASSSSSSRMMDVKDVAKAGDQGGEQGGGQGEDYEVNTVAEIPSLFSRIMATERQNTGRLQDFLVIAVHAVMLETGFVVVGCGDNRIAWNSLGSLKYTLPELANQSDVHVLLTCQIVGDFLVVYGSVSGCEQSHRVSLSVSKFLNPVDAGDIGVYKDVFALWKELKDNFTLRLLELLCESAGLPIPPCFQILPTEVKLKILECLTPTALANTACVSSELRFLASSEDLWKIMYLKQFKHWARALQPSSWKQAFAQEWSDDCRRRRYFTSRTFVVRRHPPLPYRFGGDYDTYPPGFMPEPFIPTFRRFPRHNCDFGIGDDVDDWPQDVPFPGPRGE